MQNRFTERTLWRNHLFSYFLPFAWWDFTLAIVSKEAFMKEKYCSEVFLNLQEDIGGKLRESWTEWCHEEFVMLENIKRKLVSSKVKIIMFAYFQIAPTECRAALWHIESAVWLRLLLASNEAKKSSKAPFRNVVRHTNITITVRHSQLLQKQAHLVAMCWRCTISTKDRIAAWLQNFWTGLYQLPKLICFTVSAQQCMA